MFSVLSKKAYKNAILVWLLSSFIFTVPLLGQDRGTVCSTPDLSYAQTESFTAVLKSRKAKKARGLKDYVNYDLPVHLYIIADEEGNLPQTSSFPYESVEQMTEIFKSSLQSVSRELHDNIDFYLCSVTVLRDSSANLVGNPTFMVNDLFARYPEAEDTNSIRVFVNSESTGYGVFSSNAIKMPAGGIGIHPFLLHEFGHYFGLLHTNTGSASRDANGNVCPALYPDHTPIPGCHPDPLRDCDGLEPGECFGDRIVDTPVDFMQKECRTEFFEGDGSVFGANCPVSCPVMVNGEEVVYLRDYSNAMDFTWEYQARIALSPGQKERIYETLVDTTEGSHPFAYANGAILGNMTFLTDENYPVCQTLEQNSTLMAATGRIDILTSFKQNTTTMPFPYGRINTIFHPVTSFGDLALGKGVFETDFILNELGLFNDEKDGVSIGFYSFSGLGNYCEGDANVEAYFPYKKASYEISVLDHVLTLRHILGLEEFSSPYQQLVADMNYDGEISVFDMREMSKAVLGDLHNHDHVYNWLFFPKSNLSDSTFQEQFNLDPFGAELMHNGELLSYLPNEGNRTYIGRKSSSKSNRSSLYYPFSDSRISDIDTWSFLALKYGNVDMSYDESSAEDTDSFFEEEIAEEALTLTYLKRPGRSQMRVGVENAKSSAYGVRYKIQVVPGANLKLHGIQPVDRDIDSADDYFYSQVSETMIEVVWLPANGKNLAEASEFFDVDIEWLPGDNSKGNDVILSGKIVYLIEKDLSFDDKQYSIPVAEVIVPEKAKDAETECLVYPNPTSSNVSISLPGEDLGFSDECVLNLYDVRGHKVQINIYVDNGRIVVTKDQLSRLTTGMILFQTEFRGRSYSGKFMKQ
jgi:hypothetical protein